MARTTKGQPTDGCEACAAAGCEQLDPTSETNRAWFEAVAECSLGATAAWRWFGDRVLIHRLASDDFTREWRSEFDGVGRLWISAREANAGHEFVLQWTFSRDEVRAGWLAAGADLEPGPLLCTNAPCAGVEPEGA